MLELIDLSSLTIGSVFMLGVLIGVVAGAMIISVYHTWRR